MRFSQGEFGNQASNTAWREVMPLAALRAEAARTTLAAQAEAGPVRAERLIASAALQRELARRTGEVEPLLRAGTAAQRARREAGDDTALKALAGLDLAETQRLSFQLYADPDSAASARAEIELALALIPAPAVAARLRALSRQLAATEALASADPAALTSAAEGLEVALKIETARRSAVEAEADIACDRADLLLALGGLTHDRRPLVEAERTLAAILRRLDADRAPLTQARTAVLHAQALQALGEIAGEPALIAEAVAALNDTVALLTEDHAPLAYAHAGHALGLALQAMGEACEEEALFDRAVRALSPALAALEAVPALPYRAVVAHDGAACLARRAERRGDLAALEQAEATFRQSLKTREAVRDPVAWAVTQVALARIYEAQSGLRPDTGERADAAFALASALDVFTEHGLRTLAAATLAALDRVKVAA